jgi:putative drug exporter of the RND superfamily
VRLRLPHPHRPASLRKRLMRTLMSRLAVGLIVAGCGTFYAVHTVLVDHMKDQLNATAVAAEQWVNTFPAGQFPVMSGKIAADQPWIMMSNAGILPSYMALCRPDGSVASTVGTGPELSAAQHVGPPGTGSQLDGAVFMTIDFGRTPYLVRVSRLPEGRGYVVLASSESEIQSTMASMAKIEGLAALLTFVMVGCLSNYRIRRHMRPFERMGTQIIAIGAGELDQRVQPDDPASEVGRVGGSVNAMLARLEQAFAEQRTSEDRLRRFIADASHELRTPLASIRGYAELFRRGASSRPEDLALAMSRIESESARMGTLVDELLLLARLDSGRPLGRGRVDLAALAADAARDSEAADPRWPIEVGCCTDAAGTGPDRPIEVVGDADRLRQVLANLLANVRAHTPPGTEAAISVRRAGSQAVIEVADTGPGLTEEQRGRVFERFYRGDASRRRGDGTGGSGLGLSIVSSVAAAHGGSAEVRSVPGAGTVFTVRLPLDGTEAEAETEAEADGSTSNYGAPNTRVPNGSTLNGRTLTGASQEAHSASPAAAASLSPSAPSTGPAHERETKRGTDAMERLSAFVIRRRRLIGLFWLVALMVGGIASSVLTNHLDQTFAMPGQPSYVANQAIAATYGNGGSMTSLVPVVKVPAGQSARSARVVAAFQSLDTIPGIRVADYADTGDARFIGNDGRTTFAEVFTPGVDSFNAASQQAATGTEIQQRLTAALPAGSQVEITGENPLSNAGSDSGKGLNILDEIMIGALGALAVLLFVFASFLAFVPLLVAAVSVTTAFLAILGVTEVTDVSEIVQYLVGLIGLGIAIDYSLLLVTRWREELAHGYENHEAIKRAMATAGRAVAFSGVTVALGLLSLMVLPVPFLRSVGYGGVIIPLVSVLVTLTMVPALLAGVGRRLDWPKIRHEDKASRAWTAWARLVIRRRWIAVAGALAVLGVLAFSALGMVVGDASSNALAQSGPAHQGVVTLEDAGVPSGVLTPIEILVPSTSSATQARSEAASVSGVDLVVAPTGAAWDRPGWTLLTAVPNAEGTSSQGEATTRAVRSALSPTADVLIGGLGAGEVDMIHAVYGHFPLMLAILGLLTFVLLARAFRSIVLPLKAVLLNLLSLAAVYGAVVLVWQKGYGSNAVWGIPATGAITAWIPLMVFAFLYGLSMDYEVFILSRMREEYDATGSTGKAIVTGIGRTGRLVTSAALILFLAMAALASAPVTQIKIFASALGIGILLDATIVRALLVPALISLFGRWNWWMPTWCARILRVEPSPLRREVPGGSGAASETGQEGPASLPVKGADAGGSAPVTEPLDTSRR